MRTPEEIKKSLVYCSTNHTICPADCAYEDECGMGCQDSLLTDALEYIEQLELERDSLRSELTLHWGVCGECDNDECPIVEYLKTGGKAGESK